MYMWWQNISLELNNFTYPAKFQPCCVTFVATDGELYYFQEILLWIYKSEDHDETFVAVEVQVQRFRLWKKSLMDTLLRLDVAY